MKTRKRFLAALLCVCMAVCLLPTMALAEGAVSMRLQVDGQTPAVGAYEVRFDGADASEASGVFTGTADNAAAVSIVVTETATGLSHTATVDLSSDYELKLYHYADKLDTAPIGSWYNTRTAVSGTDYRYTEYTKNVQIYTALGLAWLSQQPDLTDYTITLESDVDMSAHEWSGISQNLWFMGSFDGRGHTVYGLFCDDDIENAGLFCSVGANGVVKNVGIAQGYLSGNAAGAITGQNSGSILNCWSDSVTRSGTGGRSGGIAAITTAEPKNCCFYGKCEEAPSGADYYRQKDGTWVGSADAAAAALALETEALKHSDYTHWRLVNGQPAFFAGTTLDAAVKVTLNGTAAELSSVLDGGAALTLGSGGTALTGTGGTYTATGVMPGLYGIYNGATQLGTALISTVQPQVTLDFYSITVAAGTGIASVSRTGAGINAYLGGTSANITATVKPAYRWKNWTSGETVISTDQTAAVTVNRTAVTFTANALPAEHTITYQITGSYFANDGYAIQLDIPYGTPLTLIADDMSQSGYTFSGWSGLPTAMPDHDVTVTGSYTVSRPSSSGDSTDYYTLTFNTNGGSGFSSIRPAEYTTVDLSKYTPTREGCTFTGWYSDKDLTTPITSIKLTKNTTVYAGWTWINPFTDVADDDWFHDDVEKIFELRLMEGTSDTTFSPYATTTRGMIVTILYRLAGEPAVSGANPFNDVTADSYYEKAVTWAAEKGIVGGYGSGKFGPDDPITREQLAAILYRYEQYKGGGFVGSWYFPLDYPDAAEISAWADEAMHWCVMNGIIQGNAGNLMPKDGAARAQAAAMLVRFLSAVAK